MYRLGFEAEFIAPDWVSFHALFCRLYLSVEIPKGTPLPAWKGLPGVAAMGYELYLAEQPWESAVDALIEELCSSGIAETNSVEIAYFVSLRAETVAFQLLTMVVGHGEIGTSTIIPFPNQSPLRVARWFLVPWWRSNGRTAAGRDQLIQGMESSG